MVQPCKLWLEGNQTWLVAQRVRLQPWSRNHGVPPRPPLPPAQQSRSDVLNQQRRFGTLPHDDMLNVCGVSVSVDKDVAVNIEQCVLWRLKQGVAMVVVVGVVVLVVAVDGWLL